MEGEGGGEGGEKRTEMEMDVTPQQDNTGVTTVYMYCLE